MGRMVRIAASGGLCRGHTHLEAVRSIRPECSLEWEAACEGAKDRGIFTMFVTSGTRPQAEALEATASVCAGFKMALPI